MTIGGHANETMVIVGTIPCLVSTGENGEGSRGMHAVVSGHAKGMVNPEGKDMNDIRKRARLLTHAGWEVVGPSYSVGPWGHIGGEEHD
jgi:hypothetical protein